MHKKEAPAGYGTFPALLRLDLSLGAGAVDNAFFRA